MLANPLPTSPGTPEPTSASAKVPFVTQIGWKDENELRDLVRTIHSLLVYGQPPQNGWTWYKFQKQVYNTIKASSERTVRLESEYWVVWEQLRVYYRNMALGKCTQESALLPPSIIKLLNEIQQHIDTDESALDILSEETTRVWDCSSWMFPQEIRHLFTNSTSSLPVDQAAREANGAPQSINCSFFHAPLMIANCPLPAHMQDLWNNSGPRLCADGGANRLLKWSSQIHSTPNDPTIAPHYIIGDIDSLNPETRQIYESLGTVVVPILGQDNTDLDKTLDFFDSLPENRYLTHIMITGALGGNVSQEFANYNSCWRHKKRQIAFVGDMGMVFYLAPGKHIIRASPGLKCGIIPLGESCASITTTGLQWNLDQAEMQFGVLISSSNRTTGATVTIANSHPVLWTFDCAS